MVEALFIVIYNSQLGSGLAMHVFISSLVRHQLISCLFAPGTLNQEMDTPEPSLGTTNALHQFDLKCGFCLLEGSFIYFQ